MFPHANQIKYLQGRDFSIQAIIFIIYSNKPYAIFTTVPHH
jgi:hypothetical protein